MADDNDLDAIDRLAMLDNDATLDGAAIAAGLKALAEAVRELREGIDDIRSGMEGLRTDEVEDVRCRGELEALDSKVRRLDAEFRVLREKDAPPEPGLYFGDPPSGSKPRKR